MAKPTTPLRDDDDAPQPGLLASVPLDDGQVKGLKIAVMIMTGILVLGVLTLFGRIIYLVARPSPQAAGVVSAAVAGRTPAATVTVPLPAGATVRQTSLAGDRLAVHYDAPTGGGVLLVDTVSGQIISRIMLKPEPSKP
jgi:hypothetical protein